MHRARELLAKANVQFGLVFKGTTAQAASEDLKSRLVRLTIPDAESFRPHDFRRGHARDLQRRGRRLNEILKAGEWTSPRFLEYLDRCELEDAAILEAHLDEESDED